VSALAFGGCVGNINSQNMDDGGSSTGSGSSSGSGGGKSSGSGGGTSSGSGGGSQSGTGGSNGSGGSTSGTGSGGSGGGGMVSGSGGSTVSLDCSAKAPGRSPLRRLTTYEYNNTIRDLLGDTMNPGGSLPAQVDSKQNLFGNDADEQAPSSLLVEKYQSVAEAVAGRATASTTALGKLHTCASNVTTANEESCARMIATTLAPRAYRRTVPTSEVDELVAMFKDIRALSGATFASSVAGMIEAMLQAPDFLYRIELGQAVSGNSTVKRIAGREMATRLSYLFWQTMPDAALFQAADGGMLDTSDGVKQQAQKMLDDQKSHAMVAFFFDNLLPIPDLSGLTRDTTVFPKWSSSIGASMRNEVQRFLEYEIFENTAQVAAPYAAGSWQAILTAPYTFVDKTLFAYYGSATFASGTNVTATSLTKVNLNTSQRLGLLTLGGMAAGSTISSNTNPVLRGTFVLNKLMCKNIELPVGFTPMAPDPYSGKTARERYSKHSESASCRPCHQFIDPMGLPFENYDAVGMYRETEKWTDMTTNMTYNTQIDASGSVLGVDGSAKNAIELVQLLAKSPDVGNCFASHWMRFAYGRSLTDGDACNQQTVDNAFKDAGYNIKQLLLTLTQSDGFLYRTAQ